MSYDVSLTMKLLQGIKDIASIIDLSSAQTASQSITIDLDGNIGIGTENPAYKMHVIGDIAATSFVNISTKEAKKDIEYLNETDNENILNKIIDTKTAKYRYNQEKGDDPLRMGLIAEEAPDEVLSKDKKGIDIYKMSTFLMSGLKALNKKVEGMTSHTYTITKVEDLTVGSVERPTGITLYDETTRDPYCVKMRGGYLVSIFGDCNNITNPSSSVIGNDNEVITSETTETTETTNNEQNTEEQNISEPENTETAVEESVTEEPVIVVEVPEEEIVIENTSTTN